MTASPLTGRWPRRAPLGGAETAFVALAEALAGRGHRVEVRNRCAAALTHNGVRWAPLSADIPEACDLYIGNRGHRVIGLVRRAGRRLFWLHNPAGHLRKPRNLWRLARYRPLLVATGVYHAATIPAWLPCAGRRIIPYGVLDLFAGRARASRRRRVRSSPRTRCAGSTGCSICGCARIRPAVPGAELHIYAGGAVYGQAALPKAGRMAEILARADTLAAAGVRRFAPVGHQALAAALTGARAMLYRGDPGETFCLALAEAQAMGVPAVVTPLGAVGERVRDGVSGRVAPNDDGVCRGRGRGDRAMTRCGGAGIWARSNISAG